MGVMRKAWILPVFFVLAILMAAVSAQAAELTAPALSLAQQENGNTFSVQIEGDENTADDACVLCAGYGDDGRMLDIRAAAYSTEGVFTFTFSDTKIKTVKTFFVSGSGAPLCAAAGLEHITIPSAPEKELVDTGTGHILVAYFSFTGNTETIAGYIAEESGADVYEIVPEIPYGEENNSYYDKTTRAYQEQYDGDNSTRPEIATEIKDISGYDVIFLGFPTWYGQAPRIINTFLERYDFSGKTIIPFHSCASSSISNMSRVQASAPGAMFQPIKKFGSVSKDGVTAWVDELGYQKETAMKINLTINGRTLTATLADNTSAQALYDLLAAGSVTVSMRDYNRMEKVGTLPQSLPRNDEPISTDYGDLILYQGNQFVIYYSTNTYSLTRLGHIDNVTQQELKTILGDSDVTVTLSRGK